MDTFQTHYLPEQSPYNEILELLHRKGLKCPNGHAVIEARKNIYKRDPKGIPRYKCKYPGCSKSFNLFTGTPLQGSSLTPKEVIDCVNGILEKKDIKELSHDSGILERRLKKYYYCFKDLSRQKRLTQFPILQDWEGIFDQILTAGEACLPTREYRNLKGLVFQVLKTAGSTTLWKNLLENVADWDIIDDFGEEYLILTIGNSKQYKLKKTSFKEIDPKTGRTKSIKRFTKVTT